MKKRNQFRAIVLMLLTLSLVVSSVIYVSAAPAADGLVLLEEDMLKNRDLSDIFTVTNGGAAVYENGKLKFTGGGNAINTFDLTGVTLGLGTDITSYTVQADLYFDTLANNLRGDFGVREKSYAGVKNQDNCTGISVVRASGKVKATGINRATNNASSTKINAVTLNDDFVNEQNLSKIITCKIVVNEGVVSHYVSVDGGKWQTVWESGQECGKDGEEQVLFFAVRNGCTVTMDNLSVWIGCGEKKGLDDGDSINEPALYGAQMRTNDDSTYDIRFVSTIDSVDKYTEVGYVFNLSTWTGSVSIRENVKNSGYVIKKTHLAYLSINYSDAKGKVQQKNAPDGKYYMAVAIEGISLTDATDYMSGTVTPYAVDNNGKLHYGATYVVTVTDGKICTFSLEY